MIRHTVMVWNITLHFFLANPIATVLIFQSYCFMNTALTSPGIFISPYGICTFQEIICPALFFSCPIIMFLLPIEDHIRILLSVDEFRTIRLDLPVLRILCLAFLDQPGSFCIQFLHSRQFRSFRQLIKGSRAASCSSISARCNS